MRQRTLSRTHRIGILLACGLSWVLPCTASSATVVRGPYLQQGTPSSIVVRWRTDSPSESRVRYGTTSDNLALTRSNPLATTEHVVLLPDLQHDTRYYYEIGNEEGWIPAGNEQSFVTSPLPGTPKSTRIWVLGDSGTANADAAAVRDAYVDYTGARETDLWLMLGDNAYNNGTDAEYQAAVFDMYPNFLQQSVLWPALGNHDTAFSSSPPADLPYFEMFTLPTQGEAGGLSSGTEKYYSFDYANIHFVCLDSMSSDRNPSGPMLTWLANDLAATTQSWVVAYWHHPPYSKGSHDSDTETRLVQMRENALPILEAGGADLVLTGHSHSYERSFLLQGHYGKSGTLSPAMKIDAGDGREDGDGSYQKTKVDGEGSAYITAGSSGKISGGSLDHPAMYISLNQLGSLAVDVNQDRMDVTFVMADRTVGDHFTLLKAPPPTTPPAAPAGLVVAADSASRIRLTWADAATNESGFTIERSLDGQSFASLARVGVNATAYFDATVAPLTTYHYRIRAYNQVGASAWSAPAEATTPEAPIEVTLIPAGSSWRYLDDGSDQGTAWQLPAFDDQSWSSGPAQLGYGDGDEATVVSYGPDSGNKYITTYFRHAFTLADAELFTNLVLEVLRDDGLLLHINGTEAFRNNLPAGPVGYQTQASSTVGGSSESAFLTVDLDPALLLSGTNLVAAEIHQANPSSSDISFDLRLTAKAPPGGIEPPLPPASLVAAPGGQGRIDLAWEDGSDNEDGFVIHRSLDGDLFEPAGEVGMNVEAFADTRLENGTAYTYRVRAVNGGGPSPWSNTAEAVTEAGPVKTTLIASGASWKYLDDGSDQGTNWIGMGFDDAAWLNGNAQLGYGDGDEATVVDYGNDANNKHITTYFRSSFQLDQSPLTFTNLLLELVRDDGAVVYLNGAEVHRENMPAGIITAQTQAESAIGGSNESVFQNVNLPVSSLLLGKNVLAVEIHQANPSSSDISFDLRLTATSPPTPPAPSPPANFRVVP